MRNRNVAAVERALKILSVFRPGERTLPLAEIARRTGFYKSTILRLIQTLSSCGFLARLSDGTYRLGAALLHLGSLYKDSFRLEEAILPALRELMQATGESATFYVRQGAERVVLFRVDSPELLREHILPGHARPLDDTSTGLVFRRMEAEPAAKASRMLIETAGVYDSLTASCAAPLIASGGLFLGVLTVSGPTARFGAAKRKAAGKKLTEVARKLGAELGGVSAIGSPGLR
jgi:DNA-binding IclR family transcriptional regulator